MATQVGLEKSRWRRLRILRRLFNIFPIVSLSIIAFIAAVTLFLPFYSWLKPQNNLWNALHFVVYLYWLFQILINYFLVVFRGPGFVPEGWMPLLQEDSQKLQFCVRCEGFKAPRSHHCKSCDRCVFKMDHHCVFTGSCIGHENHKNFFLFVSYVPIGCLHSCILSASMIYVVLFTPRLYSRSMDFVLLLLCFNFLLALVVALAVCLLCCEQLRSISRNATGIEEWIISKAHARGRTDFIYPYNLGSRRRNFEQVLGKNLLFWLMPFSRNTECDGFWWPVVFGCDQYTFSMEQLMQKELKKQLLIPATVVRNFHGYCGILWGPRVLWDCPFIDDPRLHVNIGDKLLISRRKTHWFYAQRENDPKSRGWFPRRCIDEDSEKKQ